jgi:hypothetical protein
MAMRDWRRGSRAAVLVLSAGLFVAALFVFLRAHSYSAYQEARAEAKSIESAFPRMESDLLSAARFPGHPAALGELGRIYLERAFAEIQFGSGEKREEYLDRTRDALKEQIRRNPLDANSFYRMGIVYTLYNYPLRTYADRGWPYIIRALELSPSDEFLNVNGLYVLLAQWENLSQQDRIFVWARLREIANMNPSFISKISDLWANNFGNRDGLRDILTQDENLWLRIKSLI